MAGRVMYGFTPYGQRAWLWVFAGKFMGVVSAAVMFAATPWTPLPVAVWISCWTMAYVTSRRGDKYEQRLHWDAELEDWTMVPDVRPGWNKMPEEA